MKARGKMLAGRSGQTLTKSALRADSQSDSTSRPSSPTTLASENDSESPTRDNIAPDGNEEALLMSPTILAILRSNARFTARS